MKPRIIVTSFILAAAALAGRPASILQIRDSLHCVPSQLPESFETDVHKMQENWYLKTYADIDRDADSRASVIPSDEVFVERLGKMPTVIEMPFNSVVKNNILAYVDRRKQLVENMLGMSLYYMPIFEQALERQQLPLELKYLPIIESALNPEAVSKAGATGLWQFMLPTATGEGLEVSSLVDQRRDPYLSSEAAAKYLKKLYDIFGDWSLAIAAYNCGPGNVTKAIKRAGGGKKDFWEIYPYLPQETRGYVPAFIAANYAMNFYHLHNISPALARKPILTDTVHVTRRVHFDQISHVLDIPIVELRTLNPQYRQDVIPGDIRPYSLVLPSLQVYAYVANEDSICNYLADRYSRRGVVEPATPGSGSDRKGEYVEELSVKYHTVKKGETLASIAKRYGVTQAAIRKTNKIGKRVRTGQKLKINTYVRKYIEPAQAPVPEVKQTNVTVSSAVEDSLAAVPAILPDSVEIIEKPEPKTSEAKSKVSGAMNNSRQASAKKQTEKTVDSTSNTSRQKTKSSTTHTVVKGENLYKISKRYGVTVDELRKANNLKGDALSIDQKLVIPSKGSSGQSSSKSSSSRKRR
ncbi:MAG: transglycosylase SLT domain-containing protein [Muribaculaceae bacterium]|nr:transglycosylase SLT domain-containing protein [Muribaculaceae bacterium]